MQDGLKKISTQGFLGSFHQEAVQHLFKNKEYDIIPCSTFRNVIKSLREKESDYAVLAIENSIAGSILQNYALLQNEDLMVTGELHMRIRQNLMAIKGTKLEDINEVQSHPMALLQCSDYLENHLDKFRLVESDDTAKSAQNIAKAQSHNLAAIAGTLAAKLFDLEIIAKDIHTVSNNYTRFLVIERKEDVSSIDKEANKASIFYKLPHKHGSLVAVLNRLEQKGINMTKLQSNPIPTDPFKYLFHTDMEFENIDDFYSVIKSIEPYTTELTVSGIYKKGEFI